MKAETVSWWLNPAKKLHLKLVEGFLFYFLILFLPTQLGKHFWPDFSYVAGSRVDYLSPTLYLTDMLIIALFSCVIIGKRIRIHHYFSLAILFISLSIFFSKSPLAGWYFLAKFLEMSFLVWYVVHSRINKASIGLPFVVGIIFESTLSTLQILHQGSLGGLFYFLGERSFSPSTPGIANASVLGELVLRPYGTFSHPNMLAGYFVTAMLLSIFFLQTKGKTFRILMLFSLIFGTIGLALTLSRTNILTWILAGVVALCLVLRKRINKGILLFAGIGLSSLLLAIVFFPPILFRFLSFSFGESLSERVSLAESAMSMVISHPLFGVGPNNFISSLLVYAKNDFVLQPVHSIYLLTVAELGVSGFLIFVGFLLFLVKRLLYKWKESLTAEKKYLLPLILTFFAILFSGFFDHYWFTLQQGQLLFALVIGLIFHDANIRHDTMKK